MGGKGGGGGGSSNNMAMQMQQQSANEARMKEMQREQRLREGEAAINALFDPKPIMATRRNKASASLSNLPAGLRLRVGSGGAAGGGAAGGSGTYVSPADGQTYAGNGGAAGDWGGGGTYVSPVDGQTYTVPGYAGGSPAGGGGGDFDAAGYLAANPDIAAAVGGDPQQARVHYDTHGRSEGRQGGTRPAGGGGSAGGSAGGGAGGGASGGRATGWDEAGYLAANPDVATGVAGAGIDGRKHYDLHGKAEGRKGGEYTYDPNNPYEVVDAQGNVVYAGNDPNASGEMEWDETYDTGQKKGQFDDLFGRYETGQRNYYMPELEKQYGDARKKGYLAHAGAGTLWSSMRGDTEADIGGQKTLNQGQIESQIQDSLGGLRRQIASDKSSLINQLYATENPEMAANEALAKVRTISQQSPPLSPMGDLFKIAAIGLGGGLSAANDPYKRVSYGGVGSTSGANRNA